MDSGDKEVREAGSASLLFPALEVIQDVADDIVLGVFISVPDVRGQTFELVLFGVILLYIIVKTGHLGTLQERCRTVTTITVEIVLSQPDCGLLLEKTGRQPRH